MTAYNQHIQANVQQMLEGIMDDVCIAGASKNARNFMASADAKGDQQQADLLKRWFPVKYRLMVLRANWRTFTGAIKYMKKWSFMYRGRPQELANQATTQAAYETIEWVDGECRHMVESLDPTNKEKFEAEFEALAA